MHYDQTTGEPSNDAPDRHAALEPLLTYRQVAELLGVTDRTVWELVRKGDLVNVRVGRSVRIDPMDLRSYIASSKST